MAPDTIVAAVAAKTTWNIQNVYSHCPSPVPLSGDSRKWSIPKMPFVAPNMIPKPTSQNDNAPMDMSSMFFIMMWAAFLARVKPDSTKAKPACIQKTRQAATSVHRMLA